MSAATRDDRIAAVRRFNRFYTQRIGILAEGWARSEFSLAQARVLYEISRRDRATASDIAGDLGMDAGYLSRLLRDFERRGFIARQASHEDARRSLITLTAAGKRAFAPLERQTLKDVGEMLDVLGDDAQSRLVRAMAAIETTLVGPADASYILRAPHAGDFGWIVARHGALYAAEYGWDEQLEALTAEIIASFVRRNDPKRERCWIVERGGENVGCVLVARDTATVARLRLLLVEPSARGLGIGMRLVDECLRFARGAGYRNMTLWTHSVLVAARHIYKRTGFKRVATKKHDEFGQLLTGETWTVTL
jgi:DNA-binding MarR family transcriptional regulator/N-acetylglutamate synthase-like GNAT family acetyltransferase